MRKTLILSFVVLLLSSCKEARNVIYLKEAETLPVELLQQKTEPADVKIAVGDELSIKIESDDQEAVAAFNRQNISSDALSSSAVGGGSEGSMYNVDNDGNIVLPVIGKVSVSGLTRFDAERLIASLLYPQYVNQEPVVTVRITNFRITVLGDVSSPGVIEVKEDRINILELLAKAGDLTITGRRDNVLLIRTNADGTREIFRYDLNDKYLLFSPYYYLRQNDIVYVEQNRSKARSAFIIPSVVSFAVGLVSTSVSIANLVVTLSRY